MRAACVVVALLLAWVQASPAWAEMKLSEPDTPHYTAFGWTFLGLSLAALAIGANGLAQRDDSRTKADAAYKQYLAATSAADAITLRHATSKYANSAKAWESTANAGLALGALFLATSMVSFASDPAAAHRMLLSDRGVTLQYRF